MIPPFSHNTGSHFPTGAVDLSKLQKPVDHNSAFLAGMVWRDIACEFSLAQLIPEEILRRAIREMLRYSPDQFQPMITFYLSQVFWNTIEPREELAWLSPAWWATLQEHMRNCEASGEQHSADSEGAAAEGDPEIQFPGEPLTVTLGHSDRMAVLLALARLAEDRPGHLDNLTKIAERLQGFDLFEHFRKIAAAEQSAKVPEAV